MVDNDDYSIGEQPADGSRLFEDDGNLLTPTCPLLFSSTLLHEHIEWRQQNSTSVTSIILQLDRSLVQTRKALITYYFPEFRTAALNQMIFNSKSTSLFEFRISNNFITVPRDIGWLRHVMIRTACHWFALWTLRRWWRVTKAMTSWWRRC